MLQIALTLPLEKLNRRCNENCITVAKKKKKTTIKLTGSGILKEQIENNKKSN